MKYNNKVKVSVIIPIYNAKDTIKRTLDSLASQTLSEFEVILVDDGSNDGSSTICDEYANNDNRFKVIHQLNSGVSKARQSGLRISTGEYSIHCDADDWVEPNMLEDLITKAQNDNSDIVIADFYVNNGKSQTVSKQVPTSLNEKEILLDLMNNRLFGSLCNKLIKTELYFNNNISFFPGINHCEDLLVCIQLFQLNKIKVSYLPKAYYHYYSNPNSITHNFTRKTYEMRLKFEKKLQEILIIPEANYLCQQVSFNIFSEALIHRILTHKEIKEGLITHKSQIKKIKSLRWKLGFYFLSLNLNNIAYKFIHY